jgi:hypothetical protein
MWNHFDNKYERTNNHVEGDNNKMKLFCGAANPNVDKAVRLLQQYETTSSDKYKNAKKMTAKPPYKRPDQQKRDANFKQLKDLLNDGSINLKVYIDRIVDLYRFEPKKKYTEELEDTDDSDSEIEDDSDESVASEEDEEIDTEATTSRPFIRIGTQSDEVADDGKIPCDQCGKRYTKRGMNIHKAVHKK